MAKWNPDPWVRMMNNNYRLWPCELGLQLIFFFLFVCFLVFLKEDES